MTFDICTISPVTYHINHQYFIYNLTFYYHYDNICSLKTKNKFKEDVMIQLYTTDFVTGKNIETLGLVSGGAVQTKHIGKDVLAGVRKLVGGEVTVYSKMQDEAQAQATMDMIEDAKSMGADAIISVRFGIASIEGSSKVLAYGTAVKFV